MNKLLISFILSFFTAICSISSVAIASNCATDPNECTLSKLCEMATSSDSDGNTIWTISSDKQKHATVAQSLGIECGVKPIVDPCDLDPNECKLNQICDKATTEISGKKSWDESAEAYVSFAKKFGLTCEIKSAESDKEKVKTEVAVKIKTQCYREIETCNDISICKIISDASNGSGLPYNEYKKYITEAKSRKLSCVNSLEVVSKEDYVEDEDDNFYGKKVYICSIDTIEDCHDIEICEKAPSYEAERTWVKYNDPFSKEAQKRGLICGEDPICNGATIMKNGKVTWKLEESYYTIAAKHRGKSCNVETIPNNDIKQAFTEKPKLYRQKLQYALKQLQFYSYDIDGLWGSGTKLGFNRFINSLDQTLLKNEYQLFELLLSKVDVPSSFTITKKCSYNDPQNCLEKMNDKVLCANATTIGSNARTQWKKQNTQAAINAKAEAIKRGLSCSIGKTKSVSVSKKKVILKKKETVPNQNNAGLTAIIPNPSISAMQALAICRPQAKLAKSQGRARARSSGNYRRKTYDLDCSFGTCTARDMTPSGGMWGGILKGMTEGMAGKNAYNAVMDSCLAEYGWRD